MRREALYIKNIMLAFQKAASCIWRAGKRPFNISLIFNYCKPRSFIFLCCVYGSHSFPYFSQSGQLIFFCMLSLADYSLSLIFVYRNPGSFFICTLPLADYALSLIFIFCTKSACKLLIIFSSGSSSCHAAVRQPVQPGLLQHDDA